MAKSKSLPERVLRLTTYDELERYAQAFAEGHLNLLVICGTAGVGKSQTFKRAVGGKACWIDGNATAFGVYLQAYAHRDQPIVLDDVDGLYRERNGVRLLKALGQTDQFKSLSWQSDAPTLARNGIPRQFMTSSQVAIITNEWRTANVDVAAVEDRGHCLHFDPSALQVHQQAAGWFWDQEIFDFVAQHLHLIGQHSLRTYVLAWELKQAGLDWSQSILARVLTGTALVVAKLRGDSSFGTEEDRVSAFVALGAGCRATYFNYAKTLLPSADPPKLKLTRSAPPRVHQTSSGSMQKSQRQRLKE